MTSRVEKKDINYSELLQNILTKPLPIHVAIIMDGNGRWAENRGLPRIKGHYEGAKRVKPLVKLANALGIAHLTLYAFSIENWARPKLEVNALMRLFKSYIIQERDELHQMNGKFRLIGRLEGLPPQIVKVANEATELMKNNTGISLNLCINYGGRAEIVDAVRKILKANIPYNEINEQTISNYLYAPDIPDPDLIIRTSGEMRLSNFLLWQSAYAELYITNVLWPDFDEIEFLKAIKDYQNRERRFGKTSQQIKSKS